MTNERSDDVTIIDSVTNEVVFTVPIGEASMRARMERSSMFGERHSHRRAKRRRIQAAAPG